MSGRNIPAILGRGGDFQELGQLPLFDPYGRSWNCHGACGCVIQVMCFHERILRLKVQWKSTRLPSQINLVLISLCRVLGLCHSFKGCALPPSVLFQEYMLEMRNLSSLYGPRGIILIGRNKIRVAEEQSETIQHSQTDVSSWV